MTSAVKGGIGAVLIVLLAWATDGAAQNVPGSCPAPRTIYTFTDSSSLQALPGAPPPFCRFANLSGGQQVDLFLGAFSAASPIVQANIDVLTSLLPLQVGKTAHLARVGSGDRSQPTGNRQRSIRLERAPRRPARLPDPGVQALRLPGKASPQSKRRDRWRPI